MIINFKKDTHTLWHSDCATSYVPPMKELSDHGNLTLLECTKCKAQGLYPHGRHGKMEVEQVVL